MLKREKRLQTLICNHPYLLDPAILGCGRKERFVPGGRIDIDFQTPEGTIVVECKITPLKPRDLVQLERYVSKLRGSGEKVLKAYLIGAAPSKSFERPTVDSDPPIIVKELVTAIPSRLVLCRHGHYFHPDYRRCPFDGEDRVPGTEIIIY